MTATPMSAAPGSNAPRWRRFAIGAIITLAVIQIIPVWLLQTNPAPISQPNWDSPATKALAERACFDCHTNQTVYPWYSKVAPVSWLVTWDTVQGRRHVNFDNWAAQLAREDPAKFAKQIEREVGGGDMPPSVYLPMHPTAKLTDAERKQLIAGLQQTIAAK